ncbi:uncharacterized protein TNCV_3783961 [Trichonephila clavipes]|nr:uncharacterized protein TNCV_3783961 [Trichonephila clavipes]
MNAKALVKDEIWIKGPSWLSESNIPYNNLSDPIDTDLESIKEEKRKVAVSLLTNVEPLQSLLNLHSYTNLNKVIRITSYVLRFVNITRKRSQAT